MRERMRVQEDLEKIFSRYGFDEEFRWRDLEGLGIKNSPVFFAYSNCLKVVGRDGKNYKIYKINRSFFEGDKKSQYKLKKRPMYPKKAFIGGLCKEVIYA
jgi:hypothetical protein